MYAKLNAEKKQQFLKVYWYTAKDQFVPMDAADKRRNCHGTTPYYHGSTLAHRLFVSQVLYDR